MKILAPFKKKQDAIAKYSKGTPTKNYEYVQGRPIELQKVKQKSKQLGVTFNELLAGAIVTAYSKLDLAEERRPSQFMVLSAAGVQADVKIDDNF